MNTGRLLLRWSQINRDKSFNVEKYGRFVSDIEICSKNQYLQIISAKQIDRIERMYNA